jgi:hypothetical protein
MAEKEIQEYVDKLAEFLGEPCRFEVSRDVDIWQVFVGDGEPKSIFTFGSSEQLKSYVAGVLYGARMARVQLRHNLEKREAMYSEEIRVATDLDRVKALRTHRRETHEIIIKFLSSDN